jgi:hypothetical protein
MIQLFRMSSEAYYQRLEGHLEPRVWREVEATLREFNGYPGVQAWWRSRSHLFGEEFVNYINELQRTAEPSRWFHEIMTDE